MELEKAWRAEALILLQIIDIFIRTFRVTEVVKLKTNDDRRV